MPRPYSADRGERALAACEGRDGSRVEIARRSAVGVSPLYDWLQQAREEGRRAARPAGGGAAALGLGGGEPVIAGHEPAGVDPK